MSAEKRGEEEEAVKGGELLFCGATCWDAIGRSKAPAEGNLVSPTRLRPLIGVDIRLVAAGCSSCHCVALDVEGRCYTWGRNEKGQLGHGDIIQRDRPTVVSQLSKHKIIRAASGRSHTVVVTEDGFSMSFGWNKHGQLGTGSVKNGLNDCVCFLFSRTAGLPQYGQLGHGTDNEYNTKQSSVKLAYEAQPRPRAVASLAGETIVKVACGTNHTVAVDSNGYVYTWGFGGHGRLGHREQKDEWVPRRVDVFTKHNVLPPDALVSAGSANSACTASGGQLYMWGKMKTSGDDWMYPKPLMDLSGWNIRCMDSGAMHHFVGADSSCISWGQALYGELGYGPDGQKSSAVPKKVDILDGTHVMSVACGFAHSMVIIDRTNVGDRLDQLDVYDGKGCGKGNEEPESKTQFANKTPKKSAVKTSENSKKRKKLKDSSASEDEEKHGDVGSDDSEEQAEQKMQRGRKASGRGRGQSNGRGRGRPPMEKKSSESTQGKGKSAKRGRPKKS